MSDWNKPDSNEALKHWLLIDPLTLFQVVMLIFGRDPSHDLTGRPMGFVPIMAALKQAIERGEVPAKRTNDPNEGRHFSLDVADKTYLRQSDIRQWLMTINQRDAFFFLTDSDHWPNASTQVEGAAKQPKLRSDREQNLLRVIAALWEFSGLPKEQNTAADKLSGLMQGWGWEQPAAGTMADTILKAAANLPRNNIRS